MYCLFFAFGVSASGIYKGKVRHTRVVYLLVNVNPGGRSLSVFITAVFALP